VPNFQVVQLSAQDLQHAVADTPCECGLGCSEAMKTLCYDVMELVVQFHRDGAKEVLVAVRFPGGKIGGIELRARRFGWLARTLWKIAGSPLKWWA